MATLDAYINQLNFFANNLGKIVVKAGLEHQDDITEVVKNRLLNTGLDAKNRLIGGGQYEPFTIEDKKLKGLEYGHFTLFDTGDFHDAMFVDALGDFLFINSSDSKRNDLVSRYGEDILGLTIPETVLVTNLYIDPEIQKAINTLPKVINI